MSEHIRVAHVITRMIVGGAQELVLSVIDGLDRERFRSVLFTGIETGAEGSLLPRAERMGVEIVAVPALVRAPHPRKDLAAYRMLRRELAHGRFHIVNTYTSKAGFIGTLAARRAGVPVVIYSPQGHIFAEGGSIEGVSGRVVRTAVFRVLRVLACRAADALVALHEGDRDEQVALGLAPARKFRVIPNGIECERRAPRGVEDRARMRCALGIEGCEPVLATVGRLAAEKGHEDVLVAFAEVRRAFPDAALLVVGDGPRRAALEDKARALQCADAVRFLGLRADVPEILAVVDCFVLGSHYESFGLVLLEAMAAGVPVVATRVGGIPFVVRDGQTGFLAAPRRPGELAACMRELVGDAEKARAFGRAGQERIERHFSRRAMLQGVERLYAELLCAKGAWS